MYITYLVTNYLYIQHYDRHYHTSVCDCVYRMCDMKYILYSIYSHKNIYKIQKKKDQTKLNIKKIKLYCNIKSEPDVIEIVFLEKALVFNMFPIH